MLLLGIYYDIMRALSSVKTYLQNPSDFAFLMEIMTIIIPLGVGIILGILIVSKIISIFLEKYHSLTYFTILGLVIATVLGLLTDPITYQSGLGLVIIICGAGAFAAGFALSYLLSGK